MTQRAPVPPMGRVVLSLMEQEVTPKGMPPVAAFHVRPIMSMPQLPAPRLHELAMTASTSGPPQFMVITCQSTMHEKVLS